MTPSTSVRRRDLLKMLSVALPTGAVASTARASPAGAAEVTPAVLVVGAPTGQVAVDTAAVQSAVDRVHAAGGGQVQLQPPRAGTPYVVTQVRLRTGVELVGVSRASVLRAVHGSTLDMVVMDEPGVTHSVGIRSLVLDGGNGNMNTGDYGAQPGSFRGIVLDGSEHWERDFGARHLDNLSRIQDVLVVDVPGDGIVVTGRASEVRCRDTEVYWAEGHGWVLTGADVFVDQCTSGSAGLHGFWVAGAHNQLVGCKSFWSGRRDAVQGGDGFAVDGRRLMLTGCHAQDNLRHGFSMYKADGCVVTGAMANNSVRESFRLGATTNCLLDGVSTTGRRWDLELATGCRGNRVRVVTDGTPPTGGRSVQGSTTGNDVQVY